VTCPGTNALVASLIGSRSRPGALNSSQDHDDPAAKIDIVDVNPGDFGEVTFDVTSCGNPEYV